MNSEAKNDLLVRARRLSSRLPPTVDRGLRELAKTVLGYPGARRSVRRELQFSWLQRRSPVIVSAFGDGRLVMDTADNEIARGVYVSGGYERFYMAAVVDYLRCRHPDFGAHDTFLDVGANFGTSTIDALLHFGFARAVCFEPERSRVRLLKANLALNDVDERVTVHPIALSDRDGQGVLERSVTNGGDNWLLPEGSGATPTSAPVPCRRLDSLVAERSVSLDKVGLVWIDAQGHEASVLGGAQQLLAADIAVVVEYCPWATRSPDVLHDLETLIRDHYRSFVDVHVLALGGDDPERTTKDIGQLRDRYRGEEHTDLLLMK